MLPTHQRLVNFRPDGAFAPPEPPLILPRQRGCGVVDGSLDDRVARAGQTPGRSIRVAKSGGTMGQAEIGRRKSPRHSSSGCSLSEAARCTASRTDRSGRPGAAPRAATARYGRDSSTWWGATSKSARRAVGSRSRAGAGTTSGRCVGGGRPVPKAAEAGSRQQAEWGPGKTSGRARPPPSSRDDVRKPTSRPNVASFQRDRTRGSGSSRCFRRRPLRIRPRTPPSRSRSGRCRRRTRCSPPGVSTHRPG